MSKKLYCLANLSLRSIWGLEGVTTSRASEAFRLFGVAFVCESPSRSPENCPPSVLATSEMVVAADRGAGGSNVNRVESAGEDSAPAAPRAVPQRRGSGCGTAARTTGSDRSGGIAHLLRSIDCRAPKPEVPVDPARAGAPLGICVGLPAADGAGGSVERLGKVTCCPVVRRASAGRVESERAGCSWGCGQCGRAIRLTLAAPGPAPVPSSCT